MFRGARVSEDFFIFEKKIPPSPLKGNPRDLRSRTRQSDLSQKDNPGAGPRPRPATHAAPDDTSNAISLFYFTCCKSKTRGTGRPRALTFVGASSNIPKKILHRLERAQGASVVAACCERLVPLPPHPIPRSRSTGGD